jgi:hypothetical protein
MTENDIFAEWVIIELMGHRRLAGFLSEMEIAGRGFLRLEVPGQPGATQLYNPTAVYAITPTTEAIARALAVSNQPAPVQRWELPPAITPTEETAEALAERFADDDGPF